MAAWGKTKSVKAGLGGVLSAKLDVEKKQVATFAMTAFDSGQVRDDKKHVEMMIKVHYRTRRQSAVACVCFWEILT